MCSEIVMTPCYDNDERHICNILSRTVNVVDIGVVGSENSLLSSFSFGL